MTTSEPNAGDRAARACSAPAESVRNADQRSPVIRHSVTQWHIGIGLEFDVTSPKQNLPIGSIKRTIKMTNVKASQFTLLGIAMHHDRERTRIQCAWQADHCVGQS